MSIYISASCWYLVWLILRPWRWRLHVPPKFRLTFKGLHKKTELSTISFLLYLLSLVILFPVCQILTVLQISCIREIHKFALYLMYSYSTFVPFGLAYTRLCRRNLVLLFTATQTLRSQIALISQSGYGLWAGQQRSRGSIPSRSNKFFSSP
jgi:hypothetical protein